jgi:hypothetical protein
MNSGFETDSIAERNRRAAVIRLYFDSHIQARADRGRYRLLNPKTGRYVTVDRNALPAIAGYMPPDVLNRFERAWQHLERFKPQFARTGKSLPSNELAAAERDFERSQSAFLDALLAARKNHITWQRVDTAATPPNGTPANTRTIVTLTAEAADTPLGYYYPENGKASWFKAHGRLSVEPHQIEKLIPKGAMALLFKEEMAPSVSDPLTRFAMIRHGQFIYLVQAKRLNGRKRLFAKLVHDGRGPVHMTHWARLTGGDPVRLMRLSGIDSKELGP